MCLATEEEIKKAQDNVLKRGFATLLLIEADHTWYGTMKNQMQQNMAMGTNKYPTSVDETMNILNTFAKIGKTMVGKRHTRDLSKVTCYYCNAKTCPEKETKEGKIHTHMVESDIEAEEGDQFGYIHH